MKFYCVRHGETDWNRAHRYQGQTDTMLNDAGIRQARLLAGFMEDIDIAHAYSSDLSRAAQTAGIIGGPVGALSLHQELREFNFGKLEGVTMREARRDFPGMKIADLEFAGYGGESLAGLRARLDSFLTRLYAADDDADYLVVGHGASLRALMCLMLDIDPRHWYKMILGNASLSLIERTNGEPRLVYLNNTVYLPDSPMSSPPR
jgi:broad specificity phosphatase PhoE